MKSLVELMHSKKAAGTLAATTKAEISLTTFAVLGAALGATKAQKFSDGAASLVTSDDFLNELESELGLPGQGETEDEFVARAKASMFDMLKAKLK
ncbi:hypothetical protein SAMN05216593_101120 [Pseudomonas asturiensis]|uniref:Uncharacterized protein n=1 Tax=Pseudomonas asturiensis TaxID=1190415 RepID=A0A1M7J4Y8_9PSED|nr:hypothetical protein [Pseudomonas asturiensis]SHM48085.1 hypothetical protein SAMN05216593_101120 [Pseudomonas asturiensis]